jgi:hypothetical protein
MSLNETGTLPFTAMSADQVTAFLILRDIDSRLRIKPLADQQAELACSVEESPKIGGHSFRIGRL